SDVLARAGVTGRDYAGFLAAAKALPVRRLRPGLVFEFRRLKTDSVASRVSVRLSPEKRLSVARGETGWVETVEMIPWTAMRRRVTGTIEWAVYGALDKAVTGGFLPPVGGGGLGRATARVRRRLGPGHHPIPAHWPPAARLDTAAPSAPPVRATANAILTRAAHHDSPRRNLIALRHVNAMRTRNAPLRGFARGLHA